MPSIIKRSWRAATQRAVVAWVLAGSCAQAMNEPPLSASVCAGCHGLAGVSANRDVPSLAGQPYTLIEDNLLAFRAGLRACSESRQANSVAATLMQSMCFQVQQLDDREISELAAWFESRTFEPAEQPFDPERAAEGGVLHHELGCERCHANGGRETLGMAPVLAGQWTAFLRRALLAVRNGTRRGPDMMNQPIRGLSDEQVEALLNFYASAGPSGVP